MARPAKGLRAVGCTRSDQHSSGHQPGGGCLDGHALLDLDYSEDSRADVDLNVVMNNSGDLLELQGTAEGAPFSRQQLNSLLDLAEPGLKQLMAAQLDALHED